MLAHIQRRKKIYFCYLIYQDWDDGYWALEVLQIVNTHYFEKEKKSTQGYLVFGLLVRVGHAIYLPEYKWEENVFFSIINLLKIIQRVNKACRCFEYWNNPTHVFL